MNAKTMDENLPFTLSTSPDLTVKDIIGGWKVRWGLGRMNYSVKTGLYSIGNPDSSSPVLATANYKLTFDKLRKELKGGISAWILVIDTKGVNVWCAAGKGTFSAEEIIRQMDLTDLKNIVSHRSIILPQLAAPGVKSSLITKATGFTVKYGPVYAADLPGYLAAGCRKSGNMNLVKFGFADRMALVPVEITASLKPLAVFFLLSVLYTAIRAGALDIGAAFGEWLIYAGAVFSGAVIVPAFLPLIPFRSFALKGALTGFVFAFACLSYSGMLMLETVSSCLLAIAVSSYCALNYTGATTFTSLSGVKKEVSAAMPVYLLLIVSGAAGKIGAAVWNI